MVRLWAEKEMRNLKRLVAAGIRAPDPTEVRENVLVMTFVGDKDGWCVIHITNPDRKKLINLHIGRLRV